MQIQTKNSSVQNESKKTAVKVTYRLQTPFKSLHIMGNIAEDFNTTQEREEKRKQVKVDVPGQTTPSQINQDALIILSRLYNKDFIYTT